jgi:hypothetical protein
VTRQRRISLFVLVVGAAVAVIIGYALAAALSGKGDTATGARTTAAAGPPIAKGDLLLLDRDRVQNKAWGRLVIVSHGRRRLGALTCERVAFAAGSGICLAKSRTFPAPAFEARFFDARQRVTGKVGLRGVPSRARVSPGGRYAASTTFVSGDGYTTPGAFSTRTAIYDVHAGKSLGELESYKITKDGRPFKRTDFNFWGVTFVGDSGAFYMTLATGNDHYLVRGDLHTQTATVVRAGVECPSLSPDGTRIGFKARVGHPFQWRFHVLDLASGKETALPGDHSVDDQIAWLDDAHVAFGDGEEVMAQPADGSAPPKLYIKSAANPGRVAS